MKLDARKAQVFERKADSQGRVSLPDKEELLELLGVDSIKGKQLEVVVTDVIEDE